MISLGFAIAVIILLNIWGFKSKHPLPFMFLFPVSYIAGLRIFDVFDTPESLAVSLIVIVYSIAMGGIALALMFGHTPDPDKGD